MSQPVVEVGHFQPAPHGEPGGDQSERRHSRQDLNELPALVVSREVGDCLVQIDADKEEEDDDAGNGTDDHVSSRVHATSRSVVRPRRLTC